MDCDGAPGVPAPPASADKDRRGSPAEFASPRLPRSAALAGCPSHRTTCWPPPPRPAPAQQRVAEVYASLARSTLFILESVTGRPHVTTVGQTYRCESGSQ